MTMKHVQIEENFRKMKEMVSTHGNDYYAMFGALVMNGASIQDAINHCYDKLMRPSNECEFCSGTGEAQESCCGRPLNDMGICTDCGEHTYACGDKCEECNGSGLSETTTK